MDDTTGLPYPEWQRPLQEAILEFDRDKLAVKVLKVEALLVERLRQLHQSNDGHNERTAINDALPTLMAIKRDKLGYPDPKW